MFGEPEVLPMRASRQVLSLGVLLLGVLASSTVTAQGPTRGGVKMDFPDVEGFTRSEPKHFPNPTQGYLVSYAAKQDFVVNVYIYNSGLQRIPDGASSDVVKQEIKLIEEGLKELKRQGAYKSYTELAGDEVRIGEWPKAPSAQRRQFEIERADVGRILTDVYITGYKNHFVKIRVSYPADKQADAERAAGRVLTALGKLLAS
jgi:hypothetical protein